jgi:hypothetical protein
MKKLFLLISLIGLLFHPGLAQQTYNIPAASIQSFLDEDSLFPGFTCTVKEDNHVELQWGRNALLKGDYFVIERSNDGTHFETVGVLKIEDSSASYRIVDNPLAAGSDFYRIKCSREEGGFYYSKVLQANLSTESDFKFYPNPADKMLIIRTEHDIQLQIIDTKGQVRLNEEISPGIHITNVSALEKGSYVLKLLDKQSNRAVSEQLLKN